MLKVSYLVHHDTLLQNANHTLLQNATANLFQNSSGVLLQNATVITKCGVYNKMRWYRQGPKYVSKMFEGNSNSQK